MFIWHFFWLLMTKISTQMKKGNTSEEPEAGWLAYSWEYSASSPEEKKKSKVISDYFSNNAIFFSKDVIFTFFLKPEIKPRVSYMKGRCSTTKTYPLLWYTLVYFKCMQQYLYLCEYCYPFWMFSRENETVLQLLETKHPIVRQDD